ncbi:TIGR00180 family glycosyltransferase [Bacteroides ovatus]|uniref:TIGR00180 family glycosyltransferase n=2 Tax=Bacteroides ovatus TaxID=28116 RepID=UPI00202E85E8|nr:TIGR00180 family glycosyltransferase [Bacteroides ovatus]MCM1719080.1 TIGR00180 family glycosyltransferase [Bacteroides ovatus]MCM1864347.1 TIGR00180 family glycosyltransferase [Bacteroides ovatus]MCM1912545.1 TIGR00180 family glycosyltransferase [Bacteroides ovatus]
MIKNIIIIIPTHKRQHYLERVAWYYSQFDCEVYICDSTPEQQGYISYRKNIHYFWCPDKSFYQKILCVLDNTTAAFYALSPDDDFMKKETLIECYNKMRNDSTFSMGVGRQCFFYESFENQQFRTHVFANGLIGLNLQGSKLFNAIKFWSNYQNILWSLFRREMLKDAFQTLDKLHYNSQNFIEFTLGSKANQYGVIYVSKKYLNYRESIQAEHWGAKEDIISIFNIILKHKMREDVHKFWNQDDKRKWLNRIGLVFYLIFSSTKYVMVAMRIIRMKLLGVPIREVFVDETSLLIKKAISYVRL